MRSRDFFNKALQLSAQRQRPLYTPSQSQRPQHAIRRQPNLLSLLIALVDLAFKPLVALLQTTDLGFQLFEDVLYDYNTALAGFGVLAIAVTLIACHRRRTWSITTLHPSLSL